MRISVTYISWLLPLLASLALLQGCDQKPKPTQSQTLAPPIVDAPPPKPATVSTADLPPPVVGPPEPAPATTSDTATQPAETPKKPVHHPKKTPPATTTPTQPGQAAQPTQEAANNPAPTAPSVSAIGELSGGASGDLRSQTEDTINATEKGVNAITRKLSDPETKTAAQIHEFLKQARQALTTGDVDGAQTLVKKAKVLLAELNQ
jgi:PBP1b-binding outer membrane lipoprotein LpoB